MGLGAVFAAVLMCIGIAWWGNFIPRIPPEKLITQARAEQKQGRVAEAEALAAQAFQRDPSLTEAVLLAAECAAAQQADDRALQHLEQVSADSPGFVRVGLIKAQLLHQRLSQLSQAEAAYRAVLERQPDHPAANLGLVNLLTLCGRKFEATPFILQLIRQSAEPDTMLLLARPNMAVNDVPLLERAKRADPADPNPLVGLAWHDLDSKQWQQAETTLRAALRLAPDHLAAHLLMGKLLLSTNRSDSFADWMAKLPPTASEVADMWLVRGQMAELLDDRAGATRCFGEATQRGPESKTATFRFAQGLAEAGDHRAADELKSRIALLQALEDLQNRVLFAADRGHPELLLPLSQAYAATGRLWEAYGWGAFAKEVGVDTPELRTHLARLQERLAREPLQLVTTEANVALKMDVTRFPLPLGKPTVTSSTASSVPASASPVTFRDDAAAAKLSFEYDNGVTGPPTHRMFEFTGGGIGVLDYDLDGFPDVFLTQGCPWPPGTKDNSGGDRLQRNLDGQRFVDITAAAGIQEHDFGQGITIGDYNADGFPDVYIANIGQNALWLNAGDGTFQNVSSIAGLTTEDWTTSVLLVDLTGDGLPDLYDVNYAADKDTFDRVCQHPDGSPRLCAPSDFQGQADRVWRNRGDGRFEETTEELLGERPLGLGLGIAAWRESSSSPLSVFIANDTTPCFLFRRDDTTGSKRRYQDQAIEAGVAYNGAGKATGCMGIAVGDIDDDGRMDLHITNFLSEPNTLFVNLSPGFFEDQTRRRGLEGPSFNLLGFGTQFIDADLDGAWELFVANGHVDDLTRQNRPYKMPAQLFQMTSSGQYAEHDPAMLGPYFEGRWLGRAAVRIDWNRDGRDDLLVGHLDVPTALLTNTTATTGKNLSLRLIGTDSPREAIGTIVELRMGTRRLVRQLTAGDGYQCSNERRLNLGVGTAETIDEVTISWPSGRRQQFQNVAVPADWILREGDTPLVTSPRE